MFYNSRNEEGTSQACSQGKGTKAKGSEKPKYANLENVTPLEDHEDHIHFGNLTPYQL